MHFLLSRVRSTVSTVSSPRFRPGLVTLLWLLTLLAALPACAQWNVSYQCSGASDGQPWPSNVGPLFSGTHSEVGTVTPVFTWQGSGTPPDHLDALLQPFVEGVSAAGSPDPALSDGFGGDPVTADGDSHRVQCYHVVHKANPSNAGTVTLDPVALSAYAYGNNNTSVIVAFTASVDTGPDFLLSDAACFVPYGETGEAVTTITPINGFSGSVGLSFPNEPSGIVVTPADAGTGQPGPGGPIPVPGPSPVIVGLSVKVASYVPAGVYTFGIQGDGGSGLVRYATMTVTVVPDLALGIKHPVAPYGTGSEPSDAAGGDPVNLATGADVYHQPADLEAYNPHGPPAVFTRTAYSALALQGYGSPGLSPGWTHNYDSSLTGPATAGTWGALTLNYPNGAQEALTPVLSGGSPTGAFTTVPGAPYIVSGVPSSTAGQWLSVTLTWTDQSRWLFTPLGSAYAPTRITTRTGQGLTLAWDAARALQSVSDTTSNTPLLTLGYDGGGHLHTLTDRYGRVVTYSFGTDPLTQMTVLQSVSQIAGASARESYAYVPGYGWPLLATVTVPSPTGSGVSTDTVAYDGQYRVASFTDANNIRHTYTYGGGSTLVQVGPVGAASPAQAWTVSYDAQLRDTGTTNASGYSTAIAYGDPANPYRPTQVTDRNGHSEAMTYDPFGHVVTRTDRRNMQTTNTWDYSVFPLGRLTSVQAGTNQISQRDPVSFTYDTAGNLWTVTSAAPNSGPGGATVTTTYTHDALGNVLTVKTPGNPSTVVNGVDQGITTTYNYTTDGPYSQAAAFGEPLTATDNLGHVTHYRYTARGRLLSVTDALGDETDCGDATSAHSGGYNAADQPLLVTYPATGQTGTGHSTRTWSYLYPGGPLLGETAADEGGNAVRQVAYGLGAEGELLSATGSTEPASYAYDALYRKVSQTTGGHTTHYYYNADGYVAAMTYPGYAGSAWPNVSGPDSRRFTTFDHNGNPLTRVDGNGTVETLTYYNDDRLKSVHYAPGTGVSALGDTNLTYDAYGRPQSMTDGSGSHLYLYDESDRITTTQTNYTGVPSQNVSYAYNPDGSRASMAVSSLGGFFTYAYDAAGRMTGLTNPYAEASSWQYGDNNWLSAQTLGNGVTTAYTRNPLGEVTDLQTRTAGGTLLSEFGGITPSTALAYNAVGDLTFLNATLPAAPSNYSGTTTFQYDYGQTASAGLNRGQLTHEISTRFGGYDSVDAYDGGSATGPGNPTTLRTGASYSYNADDQFTITGCAYDGNGNPTTYGGTALTFDPEDRLTGVGTAETNTYTGDGLRAKKQFGSASVYYVYDGDLPVAEVDGSGAATAAHTFGANGLLSKKIPGNSAFYTYDPQGSVAQQTGPGGVVYASSLHDAFGNWVASAPADDVFGLGGQWGYYTDDQTGLRLCGRRFYDSNVGRFLTRDPLGYAGGKDLYAYCRNNPVSLADPSGLCPNSGSAGGELHDNYQHNHVNQQIDQTEMMLVGVALGPLLGGAGEAAELGAFGGIPVLDESGAVIGETGVPILDETGTNMVTDIDYLDYNGALIENKSAEGFATFAGDPSGWVSENIYDKFWAYYYGRTVLPGFENAPIVFQFPSQPPAQILSEIQDAISTLRGYAPGTPIWLSW